MIDKKHIGRQLPTFLATAEAGQLRFFAKAIGETNPIYFDEQAARDAGYPGLPLPPTFLFSLEFQIPSNAWRDELGIVTARILHGEESFRYHRMAYAGDTLRFDVRIADIYDKKGGALEFVVRETRVTNQHGEHVADLRSVLVQRNS
ncbi:acyl dehydratase [Pseudomonas sp. RIT-PI-q]|uniref:MaoC family dehydratase N-terminal domain-containing protein n=1 Tax=Pseudomonas caricapapayae TaxID=46678 RepID=A0ACC7M0V2_9PSED|nr:MULTISPECIES: MaoC family dehydratase N-terminal domain-containing protein [unclassified Pseudomonas]KPH01494.1 acyl dehydratase [Pseudomonas sp. RIT-PI-q]MCU1763050.1 MaoC family dehydratase N-terminal domain-containing protein [Pseudomonas sp. 14P_8.1_Bac3]